MPISNRSETVDPRILRLIGLEDVFDLDYDTYFSLLKEALVKSNMPGKSIPAEEFEMLKDELKRVKSKRNDGRFGVKKKKISTGSFSVSSVKGLIGGTKSKLLPPVSALAKSPMSGGLEGGISEIKEVMVSILETLKLQKKTDKDAADYERRKVEQEKRGLAESKLEKRFEGIKKVAENIIKPVKGLLDKILEFIGTVLLGRIVFKLIEWLGDPKNTDKVKSLIRFFKDNWPKLLSLYIIFGTSFGKFARGLISLVVKGTAALVKATAGLAAKVIGGRVGGRLGKVAGFLGGGKGKLLVAGVEAAATIGGTLALSKGLENFGGIGGGNQESKSQNFAGGGYVRPRFPAFSGGGFNFKGMMGGASMGAMFGPLGMLLGGTFGSGKPQQMMSGFVSGERGVDKVPAMLSDGEFVMSRGAVEKYGVDTLEAMNAAGGGTNKPKIMGGKTYAAGGGYIGGYGRNSRGEKNSLENIINWFKSQGIDIENPTTWSRTSNNVVGGFERNINNLTQSSVQFGTGLYNQSLNMGNRALLDVKSGKIQNAVQDRLRNTISQASQLPEKMGVGVFDSVKRMGSSKSYNKLSEVIDKNQNNMITFNDKFIKNLPDGPFKEIADKGLIPIPTGNATMMRNLTFAKALLGPLGKPFKILSNKQVDDMRNQTIERTMGKSGLIVDPKTGEVKMDWNQEDINRGAKGGGAYTDKLGPGGSAFNSILGRFSARTEGKGNTLYTDDRYNFNKTVAEYAEMAKQGLLKGSISDATYFGASMLGRFAQDIGWLNQRALGSRIEVGKIDRNKIDSKTGKAKTAEQIASDQKKMRLQQERIANQQSNKEKLESKRPWWDKMGLFGGASARIKDEEKKRKEFLKSNKSTTLYNKPQENTEQPYKSRFARPKNAGVRDIRPLPKPKSTPTNNPAGGRMNTSTRTGGARPSGHQVPSFSARNPRGGTAKAKTLGVRG